MSGPLPDPAAYTRDDLARIRKAIAAGVRTVTIGDPPKSVTYPSISELIRVAAYIEALLAAQEATRPRLRMFRFRHSRGV
jgi:hypothetical protein